MRYVTECSVGNKDKEDIEMRHIKSKKFRLFVLKDSKYGSCKYTIPVASLEEASLLYQVILFHNLIEEKLGATPNFVGFIVLQMYDNQLGKWIKAVDENGNEINLKSCNDDVVKHMREAYAACNCSEIAKKKGGNYNE